MTITQSSTRLVALTLGVAAVVAVAFSVALATPARAASICPGYTWSTNLHMGSNGASVMALQQFLNMSSKTQIAASGAGSPGMETTHFGGLTKAAVEKFQAEYSAQVLAPVGLTSPTGFVGAATRAELNALCAGGSSSTTGSTGGTTTTGTGTGGSSTITAGSQPANTVVPGSAARVPLTSFTITAGAAPVTLNSVSVQRQGASVDTDISGVELINAATGVQLGISRVLDSNHSAVIGAPITIPAGSSMTFNVAVNAPANGTTGFNTGDIATFAITAINTNGAVTASLPITGASATFNGNLVIGTDTATISSFDPNSSGSQPIGTTAYRFSGIHLAASATEDQTLKSITWFQSGSATGLANVVTVVNGTSYPTTVDSTGRYFTTVFPNGIVIPKGQSLDVYVQGDLGSGAVANTTAEFDLYRATDIYIVGNTYGYGITTTASVTGTYSSTGSHSSGFQPTSNPWFFGSTLSVTAGSISTVQNATGVASQNVAVNVPNQILGGFQTNLLGEAITAQNVTVHFNTSVAESSFGLLTNVSLVNQNGSIVAGPFNAVADSGTAQHVTFTGSITFPTGVNTYTIEGQLPTTASNNSTIQASTTPSSDWSSVTGNTTGNTISLPSTLVTMNTMTVKAASLSVTNSQSVTSQTVVAGANNFVLGQIQLDASQSGENVRLSSIPLIFTFGSNATNANLSGCQIYNGSTALNTGSRVLNTTSINSGTLTTFSLDNSLTVPKGTVLSLNVQCNISSAAPTNGTYKVSADTTASDYTATGMTSGTSVTVTGAGGGTIANVGTAPTMTVSGAGTITLTVDPTSPSLALAAGGTTGAVMGVYRFHATNEAINLTKVGLILTSGSASELSNVYLYGPTSTLLGTMQFTGTSTVATSTLATPLTLAANSDTLVTVKADLAAIGPNQAGTDGATIKIDPSSAQGNGISSGTTINSGATTGVNGVVAYRTYPTIALGTLPSAGVAGDGRLIEFQVSANNSNSLGLEQFVFKIASTTSVTIGTPALYAYTDSGYSLPASGTNGGVVTLNSFTYTNTPTAGNNYATTTLSSPLQVPAGGSLYFLLKTPSVSYTGSANTYSISTTLLGDATAPGTGVTSTTTLLAGSNMIWSPNATSTGSLTTGAAGSGDWTNSASVSGLPSIGITQNRTN